MFKKQYFNVIPVDVINKLIEDYNSKDEYQTVTMNKADPGLSLSVVLPYIRDVLEFDIDYKGGNFYKHTHPYLPHTDYRIDLDNNLNVVIPLKNSGEQASLVVFDQSWPRDSVTWCLDGKLIEFTVNTGIEGRPYDYDAVDNLTFEPIEKDFYDRYLSHRNRDCFFGLSGDAFRFLPTSIIVFDNKLIHCTSKFRGEKLGLSLRFNAI